MWRLNIENVGGIRSGTATIQPGINAIQASNWQGKSSLIAAIETVIGTRTPLTEGENHGRAKLETSDRSVVIELDRENGTVTRQGEAYLTDEQDLVCAELFAFLDESNPIRRAVRNGESLEDLLTRPLELENLEQQIADLQNERRQVETELEAAEDAAQELTRLQERITRLESEVTELRAKRDDVEDDEGEANDQRDQLSSKRAARDRTRSRISDFDTQIEDLEDRLEDRRSELDTLDIPDESALESDLAAKRDELSELESKVDLLQTVYNANKRVLDEDYVDFLTDVSREIMEDELTCWVCGEQTGSSAFEQRLTDLNEKIATLRQQANDLRNEVDDLQNQHQQLRDRRRRKADLEEEIHDLESRLTDRRTAREDAIERLSDLEAEVEELEADVETTDGQLTDIESEIKYKQAELDDARGELESLEAKAGQREHLQAQIDTITDEIEELRTRQERLKQSVHTAFDEAMEDVLEAFDPGFEGAWLDNFELRIAREGRSASIDALSEGEVELLGIIAALAGYEAFDVGERVPVILLDGLGSLASEHLHRLVGFLGERAEYVVTTAYPEAGDFEGHTISPDDWSVVSDRVEAAS